MIRTVITGKTSFIANAAVDHFARFPDRLSARTVSVREDGWRDSGFADADAVIHCAGIAHVKRDPAMDEAYMRVNRDLAIEAARRAKADGVRHFVFLSSIIVYGEASPAGKRKIIGPDTPPAPAGAYGQSKLEAEKGILALQDDDFTVSILRLPMVYGKGCKGNYNMLSRLARKLPVFPEFENNRSVLYVGNLSECLRLIVENRLGGIFYPQDERIMSTGGLVALIADVCGRKMHFLRCLNPLVKLAGRKGIVRRAFGDMAYAPEMSVMPFDYRIYNPETAVRNTEK